MVHAFRSRICRMFLLDAFMKIGLSSISYRYMNVQKQTVQSKKIKKWLDTPNLKTYEKYIADWHFFLKDLQEYVMNLAFDSSANSDGTIGRSVCMCDAVLSYALSGRWGFYSEFYKRLEKSRLFTQSIGI